MARPLRIQFPGAYYHIACRGNRRQRIFLDGDDEYWFLTLLRESLEIYQVIAYCYVLMPNHFHFLVKVKSFEEILKFSKKTVSNKSDQFQRGESDLNDFILDQYRKYFSSFALAYNHRNKQRGQLFLKRFKIYGFSPF